MKKILLVDGNNILFRSFYVTYVTGNVMKNSKGFPTNALYGMVNTLNKIIEDENPTHIMIAFDKGKTFRHEKFVDYKDGRKETPKELKEQFPLSRELVNAMGIEYFEVENYEADDIIGTFSKAVDESEDYTAVIISSDKDLLQLITDKVEVRLLQRRDYTRMDKAEFIKTYGIDPIRMIDLKALMGDPSDNIVGVKGIGEKTALKLLQEYETLDNLYAHIDEIKGKVKENLIEFKKDAYDSYFLATIVTDIKMDTDFEKIKYRGYDSLKFIDMLEDLEFKSILNRLNLTKEVQHKDTMDVVQVKSMKDIEITSDFALYIYTDQPNYHKGNVIGLSLCDENNNFFIPFDVFMEDPNKILLSSYQKYTYDLKKLLVILKKNNLIITNCNYDLSMALYLLNYNVTDDISDILNMERINSLKDEDIKEEYIQELAKKSKYIFDTKERYLKELESDESLDLFNNIEMPLISVLADMEFVGIKIDKEFLKEMGVEIDTKISILEKDIYKIADKEFNILSPKQLGEVLFLDLGIRYPKKVKDNKFSTSKDILDKVINEHEIIEKILEYRNLSKLSSNYIKGLFSEIHEDGRIHTIFKQNLTRTGRLSSVNPNLQNIPIRLDYGRLIRKAFVPDDNSVLLSGDYSQIELRVFAHISKSPHMIESFIKKEDIHRRTASEIFNVPINEVTPLQRSKAKAVNFGILYGISSFGLAWDLNIDINEAKSFIDKYLELYPSISEYMKNIIESAKKDGYVKTIMNRKRRIEELESTNYMTRMAGERIAFNTPIQGSSADILKKAMIEIFNEFNKRKLKSKMIIQVHDELVFNVIKEEQEDVEVIVREIMENTFKLDVPLVVDMDKGSNWYNVK